MELVAHGGHCCGIFHIHGMGDSPMAHGRGGQRRAQELSALISEFENENGEDEALPRLLEVVIVDRQEQAGWPEELRRQGFRKAFRFLNGNTGRHCNVWHWHGAAQGGNARDYQVYDPNAVVPVVPMAPVAPAPQPPRQERRIVFRTYHCVYRDGRRGAGYDSENAARQANPRARQIDVREIWSDGQTAWNVGVPLPRNQG